ncbi:dynamin family protein [Frankia sp. CcWB2]
MTAANAAVVERFRSVASILPVDDRATFELAQALVRCADRQREPMRVAVAGQIKRGKSTVVNAIVGEKVAPTGQLELTFNVVELGHAPTRSVRIHLIDNTVVD